LVSHRSVRFNTFPQLIDPPAGWIVERYEDYVSMFPPTRDAELRLTTFDVETTRAVPARWVAVVVHANRKLGRTVVDSHYGPFAGSAMETVALETRIRGWFLHAGLLPLVITYRCATSVGKRDDEIVEAALQTLRLDGAAV
jgi:hypothetical protein